MTSVAASSLPPVSSMPVESATFERNIALRQLRIIARGRAAVRCLRPETASAPRSCTACRTSWMSFGSCDRLAEPDRNAARMRRRPLPEKLAAAKAEDAAPQLVEVNGNDRRAGAALDFQHARLEPLQLPGAADAAFRKDAHQLAGLQRLARRFDRAAASTWASA